MTSIELKQLITGFENGTLPKEKWTHQAHFLMAIWYCFHKPLPEAIDCIRNGIKKYNEAVGGKNTDTSGYHETITLNYTKLIATYIITCKEYQCFECLLTSLPKQIFLDKDYLLRFYSKDELMSVAARKNYINPDLKN